MEEKIKAFAQSLGAAACGICQGETESESVIVCLFPYYHEHSGNISLHATGRDYHKVVGEKLAKLSDYLTSLFPQATVSMQVDIGSPVDKHYAQKSGVGFYGKHSLIIGDSCGSYAFIGFCKIDRPLRADAPNENSCLGCNKCIKACPGGAIQPDGGIVAEKCASSISQKKGELSPEEIAILKKSGKVWGCDRCQEACPHNKDILPSLPELRTLEVTNLYANDLEGLSNREFAEKYGEFSFSWRGKSVLLRNCRILEGIKEEKKGKL